MEPYLPSWIATTQILTGLQINGLINISKVRSWTR